MSRLVALMFTDPFRADEARAAAYRMGVEGLMDLDETGVVIKQKDGKVRVSQDLNVVANRDGGQMIGALMAAVTGVTPATPHDAPRGRLIGKLIDYAVTNRFIQHISADLQPGMSALILLARSDAERRQKIVERLRYFKPKVVETDLPREMEQELLKCLEQGAA